MRFWRLWVGALFALIAVGLVGPVVATVLTPPESQVIDEQRGNAHIYFTAQPGRVRDYEDCQQVTWQLSGIQSVELNEMDVVGEGTHEICGTTPYLAITFQDGTSEYYWLPRTVLWTVDARLNILIAGALLLALPFVLSARLWSGLVRLLQRLPIAGPAVIAIQNVPRSVLLLVLAITAIGFVLRLLYINQPIWTDEARIYLKYITQPATFGLTNYDEPGNHVFHTLLVNIAHAIFGHNENWVIRLPAFLAGVLLIPATYWAGSSLYNRAAGLVAAALVSTSTMLVSYSVNARGYTLLCLFFMLLIGLGTQLRLRPNWRLWSVFAVVSALGFYTVPTMLFPYAGCMVWLLISIITNTHGEQRRKMQFQLVASGLITIVLTLLLYLPIIQSSGLRALVGNPFVTPRTWSAFSGDLVALPGRLWHFTTMDMPLVLQWLYAGLLIVGLWSQRGDRLKGGALAIVTVATTLAIVLAQRVIGADRVFLFLLPLFSIVVGGGVVRLVQRRWPTTERASVRVGWAALVYAAVMTVFVVGNGYLADTTYVEVTQVAEQLETVIRPMDGIATVARVDNYEFEFRRREFALDPLFDDDNLIKRLYVITRGSETARQVLRFNHFDPADFTAPELWREGVSYSIYTVDHAA